MASTSNTTRYSSESEAPSKSALISARRTSLRRARPSQVQTGLQSHSQITSVPASAMSASSVTSCSQQDSPPLSPENTMLTMNSSVQPSPDPSRSQETEPFPPPPPLNLGDPLLSRKPSVNSMSHSIATTSNSMAEVMRTQNASKGLMRRLSNKATKFARSRRQSSVTPNSRDGSLGPGILRRRSDSTNTAPPEPSIYTDSDEEIPDDKDELYSLNGVDFAPVSTSATASLAGSSTPIDPRAGPVIPMDLLKGTLLTKISNKNKSRNKPILLVLDTEAAKVTWDKSRPSKSIYIDDIKEIRVGSDIRQYCLDYGIPETDEHLFFSILYAVPEKPKGKVMHVIAANESDFHLWVDTLDALSKHRQELMTSLMSFNDKAIRSYWNSEMAKQFDNKPHSVDEEEIDLPGVERVCRNLHIHVSPKVLQEKFAIASTTPRGRLNFTEFQVFVKEMKRREDIASIFYKIATEPEQGVTWADFLRFLYNDQGEDVDANVRSWEGKFRLFARPVRTREADTSEVELEALRMSESALAAFLTSTYNLPLLSEPAEYTLDRPLNEYFISSSHNTYLIGRQYADLSSVEGYIEALVRGCRSVEVDCWNGADGQPVVRHGHAMTNPISFRETMNTINKYAFVASRYPLIVSLEVHCNAIQQTIMASVIRQVFGHRLVTEPLDPTSDKLPSPSELMDRILIKVKAPGQEGPQQRAPAEANGRRRGNSLTSPYIKPVAADNSPIPNQFLSQSPLLSPAAGSRRLIGKRVNTITEGQVPDLTSSSPSDSESGSDSSRSASKPSKIVKTLGELGVYCSGIKFDNFDTPECKMHNHILSFMEGTFAKHAKSKDGKISISRHNMRYLMRVYPQFTRYNSNNFNPLMYWRKGVQMAALNWQTFDLGMQLNQAMFDAGTDRSGYVLKPHSMREIRIFQTDDYPVDKKERKNVTFTIDVISAQQLMRPANLPSNRSVDPYIEVEVFHANDKRDKHDSSFGIPTPTDTPLKFRTQIVKENGFNPVFNRKFEFNITTKFPELIFVRWTVKLSSDGDSVSDRATPLGLYVAKLDSLKQGYRTLPLYDAHGDRYLFSTLFCNIKVDSVTDIFVPTPDPSQESVGKLKSISNKVFNRSMPSPKTGFEKSGFDRLGIDKLGIDHGAPEFLHQSTFRSV